MSDAPQIETRFDPEEPIIAHVQNLRAAVTAVIQMADVGANGPAPAAGLPLNQRFRLTLLDVIEQLSYVRARLDEVDRKLLVQVKEEADSRRQKIQRRERSGRADFDWMRDIIDDCEREQIEAERDEQRRTPILDTLPEDAPVSFSIVAKAPAPFAEQINERLNVAHASADALFVRVPYEFARCTETCHCRITGGPAGPLTSIGHLVDITRGAFKGARGSIIEASALPGGEREVMVRIYSWRMTE